MKKPCDCLNHCGDDDWLRQGKAQPCTNRILIDWDSALKVEAAREQKRKAELYDHMLGVARANGFNSITEAIAVAKKKPEIQFEAHAKRFTDQGRGMIGIFATGVHVSVDSVDNDRCPFEIDAFYRVTIERL